MKIIAVIGLSALFFVNAEAQENRRSINDHRHYERNDHNRYIQRESHSYSDGRSNRYPTQSNYYHSERGNSYRNSYNQGRFTRNQVSYRDRREYATVRRLPEDYCVVKYRNRDYYFDNHRYYSYTNGYYREIIPEFGFVINYIPNNCTKVSFGINNYFVFNGIFYNRVNRGYEVVRPAIGTIVYELPYDFEYVYINGNAYYQYANVIYEQIQYNGVRAFEVIGIIS